MGLSPLTLKLIHRRVHDLAKVFNLHVTTHCKIKNYCYGCGLSSPYGRRTRRKVSLYSAGPIRLRFPLFRIYYPSVGDFQHDFRDPEN